MSLNRNSAFLDILHMSISTPNAAPNKRAKTNPAMANGNMSKSGMNSKIPNTPKAKLYPTALTVMVLIETSGNSIL